MKSICIKLNNSKEIEKFMKIIDNSHIDNTIKNCKKFKIFYNYIIHYFGDEEKKFLYTISVCISQYIIDNYEKRIIRRCINKNYFYFDEFEKDIILKIAIKILELQDIEFGYREEILTEIIYDYLLSNNKIYLEGFSNFRIKEYIEILDYLVEISVMNYLKFI